MHQEPHQPNTASPCRDPFTELSHMAMKKNEVLQTLADERRKHTPNETVVACCEIWLRVYHRESQRMAAFTSHIAHRAVREA